MNNNNFSSICVILLFYIFYFIYRHYHALDIEKYKCTVPNCMFKTHNKKIYKRHQTTHYPINIHVYAITSDPTNSIKLPDIKQPEVKQPEVKST